MVDGHGLRFHEMPNLEYDSSGQSREREAVFEA